MSETCTALLLLLRISHQATAIMKLLPFFLPLIVSSGEELQSALQGWTADDGCLAFSLSLSLSHFATGAAVGLICHLMG